MKKEGSISGGASLTFSEVSPYSSHSVTIDPPRALLSLKGPSFIDVPLDCVIILLLIIKNFIFVCLSNSVLNGLIRTNKKVLQKHTNISSKSDTYKFLSDRKIVFYYFEVFVLHFEVIIIESCLVWSSIFDYIKRKKTLSDYFCLVIYMKWGGLWMWSQLAVDNINRDFKGLHFFSQTLNRKSILTIRCLVSQNHSSESSLTIPNPGLWLRPKLLNW